MRFEKFYGVVVVMAMIVIGSCAKIGSPSGGPRDEDPPVVMESSPPNGVTNFNGNGFEITFNEYVNIDQVRDKLMTSPPLENRPTVSMKGKNVIVEFDEQLRDSTTYTFYFQDAIRDLNEGNAIENFQFVFSTGGVIDSLSIKGHLYNAMTLDPPEEALVLLYRDYDHTAFQDKLPDYITRISDDGSFRIDNIREGSYMLYGLVDEDNSKNFSLPEEVIAFRDSLVIISPENNYLRDTVLLSDSIPALLEPDLYNKPADYFLYLFRPEKRSRYMTSSMRASAYELTYTLSLPPEQYRFDFNIGQPDGGYIVERNRDNDTMRVWLVDSTLYRRESLETIVNYPYTDSLGIAVTKTDSVSLRFSLPRGTDWDQIDPMKSSEPFSVVADFKSGQISPLTRLSFSADIPFGSIDSTGIHIYEIRDTVRTEHSYSLVRDSINMRKVYLQTELKKEMKYLVVAESASFSNIFGIVSDSLGIGFTVNGDDKYGKLVFNVTGYDGDRIIQLLSQNENNVIREQFSDKDGTIEIPYVDKGKYKVRVVYDINSDGKWTPGDYETLREPEPVSFFDSEIEVKINWEEIFDWDISIFNTKKERNIQ